MRNSCIFIVFLVTMSQGAFSATFVDRVAHYLDLNEIAYNFQNPNEILIFSVPGTTNFVIEKWEYPIAQPTEQDLPSVADTEAWLLEKQLEQEAARQASKPLEQRQYENAFFELTEQVLTLSSDDRAGQTPPVKLGFDELNALLEALFDTDMANATKLSIKLLSIDSALKRYNTLWWEDAIQHVLPEE